MTRARLRGSRVEARDALRGDTAEPQDCAGFGIKSTGQVQAAEAQRTLDPSVTSAALSVPGLPALEPEEPPRVHQPLRVARSDAQKPLSAVEAHAHRA